MKKSLLFDSNLVEHYRDRAAKRSRTRADFLLKIVSNDLAERLLLINRRFNCAIDLHGHSGLGAQALERSGKVKTVIRVETSAFWLKEVSSSYIAPREVLDFSFLNADLIVSLLSLHLCNDVLGCLIQIRRSLTSDGLFLGAMLGAGTLSELREAFYEAESELYGGVSPRIYPFADIRDCGKLLQRAGFAMPVSDSEQLTVRYESLSDLMNDLRNMGMQNALIGRSKRPVSKAFFSRAAEIYAKRFSDSDGRLRATFSFIWLSGWAPDPSQQQPAKPGSAQRSLKDVLEQ